MKSLKTLTVLSIALLSEPVCGLQADDNKVRISVPSVKGILELGVGETTWEAHVRADGKETQLQAMHRKDGIRITAFLQKVKFSTSPAKCRDKWWPMTAKSTPMKREDLRQYEKDGMAIVEYMIPEFRGNILHQKSVHAYLGGRGLCAEVHLSKDQYVDEDGHLFDDILRGVRFLPDKTAP